MGEEVNMAATHRRKTTGHSDEDREPSESTGTAGVAGGSGWHNASPDK